MDMSPTGHRAGPLNPSPKQGRGFRSFKTSEPIIYTQRASRDALIQATLDCHVTQISSAPDNMRSVPDAYFAFAVTLCGKTCIIALCDRTHGKTFVPPAGFQLGLALGTTHILSEPLVTTARMIWSHRHELVPPLHELRLLRRLKSNPEGASLQDLELQFQSEPDKWLSFVLALVCRGVIHLDSAHRLTDSSRIFEGPAKLPPGT